MQVTTGHYRQSQSSCFNLMNMGFVMGYAVDTVARALFDVFFCLRIRMWAWELMGGLRKTMMQNGSLLGPSLAFRVTIHC
uniref:Reactive oxygen species modulator 1 n=1 Tax=Neovison vison TaxID=452646 RepID=A0A8C7C0D8_NEOVI